MSFEDDANEFERLMDAGRYLPALAVLQRAREMYRDPLSRLFATYNIATLHWDKLGDGISARQEMLEAAKPGPAGANHPMFKLLRANALENLMLSSLSFEEFDRFTSELRDLDPEMPVVSGLPPIFHGMREHGSPWSSCLIYCAICNYDRNDPSIDRGRYGVGKSTYHLLLANRKQLRLSREDWRMAIYEYSALALRMTTDCMIRRGDDRDPYPPAEYLPILSSSYALVDEYLGAHPGDKRIREIRANMQAMVDDTYLHRRARGGG
jgi:hypothetical protein